MDQYTSETSGFGIRLDPSAIKKLNLKSRKMLPAENLRAPFL
ncbi:MAG: hypothetical protein CM15mP62_26040 [Rhodospirillaceae bacterium]|nr:MAG: hypothetical protein CM15mP62_26040 [Rhodospirillaceae bacterium]